MKEINCKTTDITLLTEQIHRVRIKAIEGELFDFEGGQYLYLLMPDGKRIPLSIASAPEEKSFIELHIRLIPGHNLAADMLQLFQKAKQIHIEGPYGRCFLRDSGNDVVIIAGGTGFSPMKSLLESALATPGERKFNLFLGAQKPDELYQTPLVNSWRVNKEQFSYTPVVSDADAGWKGAVGFPHQVALEKLPGDVSQYDYYISGSEVMVMNVYQALLDAGVSQQNIYSDILDIKREMGEKI